LSGIDVKLVNTEWLKANYDDVLILDVQPNIHDYIEEHIPNALYMNEGLFRVPYHGRPGVYVPTKCIEGAFCRLGIEKNKKILVYTAKGSFSKQGDGLAQTMAAYSLARFGVKEVLVLDGGFDKWKSEGKEITKEFPDAKDSKFKAEVQKDFYLEYDEFKKVKDDEDTILLDARPPQFYIDWGPWIKPGHIPGAINIPWKSLMHPENPTLLKEMDEVKSILEKKDIGMDKKIICSCGTGREATNEFLLFKWYLKYPDVRIYEGSFTEWSSYPKNQTVIGDSPR